MTKEKEGRKFEEFGGVFGCCVTYIATPLLFLLMVHCYHDLNSNLNEFTWANFGSEILNSLMKKEVWKFLIYYKVLVAAVYALPSLHIVEGPATPSGKKLKYKISAMTTLMIFLGIYMYLYMYDYDENLVDFSILKTDFFSLTAVSTFIAFLWQFASIIRSFFLREEDRNIQATSGNMIYDSFLGYELHPRITELFDVKIYLYRYSMVAWLMMGVWQIGEVCKQQTANNERILWWNPEILLMCLSHIAYCYAVYFGDEASCPHMFDIKYEGLGFSQTFGEIVIVPFIYTFPIFLVRDFPDHGHFYDVRIIVAIWFLVGGIVIAGASNHQKTKFRISDRKNSDIPTDDVIEAVTSSDRSLYCGGLWGWSRHPNYLGEIMTSLGWSLLCGFTHKLMWFYPIFIIPLVITRAERLERTSAEKGSETWSKYCQKVPYKIIPLIY